MRPRERRGFKKDNHSVALRQKQGEEKGWGDLTCLVG